MIGILPGIGAFLIGAGLLGWLPLRRRYVAVVVRGQSMEPTYQDGDWVLIRRGRRPERGQVIVVEHPVMGLPQGHAPQSAAMVPPYRWLVKRVAAIPGDPVPRERVPALADVPERRVPPGKLVLLGDNQQASFDSRRFGYFEADGMLGVVVRRLAIARSAPVSKRTPVVTRTFPSPPAPGRKA